MRQKVWPRQGWLLAVAAAVGGREIADPLRADLGGWMVLQQPALLIAEHPAAALRVVADVDGLPRPGPAHVVVPAVQRHPADLSAAASGQKWSCSHCRL